MANTSADAEREDEIQYGSVGMSKDEIEEKSVSFIYLTTMS